MERLNPLDAQFIDAEDEDPHTSMGIASIAVFEGPTPTYDEFVEGLAGRLPSVPRYRQKLRTVPFRLGLPVWVEDPHFDINYHVRETALPAPGGQEELAHLMARVMAQRLDRDYPLWEYWLVDGLEDGRWALISKVHHCMVDGVSGTDLYHVMFDETPEPRTAAADDHRTVTAEPSWFELAARATWTDLLLPLRSVGALAGALRNPAQLARGTSEVVQGMLKMAGSLPPATASSLTGAIGRPRRYTWVRASLDDVKMIKRELGGTVNDVVLAAISRGFRDLLLSRGEEPAPHMVPSLVPVSLRAPGEESQTGNRVAALVANLPVHVAEPVERLAAVVTELSSLKESNEAAVARAAVTLAGLIPYQVASLGVRLAMRLPQREIVTVTTNVPGPRQPLYLLGRRLIEVIPYVPISTTLRTGVSIFTYCDQVTFGITGDYATTPDLDVLAVGIENGVIELVKVAEDHKQRTSG